MFSINSTTTTFAPNLANMLAYSKPASQAIKPMPHQLELKPHLPLKCSEYCDPYWTNHKVPPHSGSKVRKSINDNRVRQTFVSTETRTKAATTHTPSRYAAPSSRTWRKNNCTKYDFYNTRMRLHYTRGSFYTGNLLHQTIPSQDHFYTRKFYIHAFTPGTFTLIF